MVIDQWIFGAPYFQTDPIAIEVKEWQLSGKHSDLDLTSTQFQKHPQLQRVTNMWSVL